MDINKLEIILENEPRFRQKQAESAIFQKFIEDWSDATDLPLALRQRLIQEYPLAIKAETIFSKTKDTLKAKLTLEDNLKVESVLMRHKDGRNTVCVSSQVGCPMGCRFCATGQMGFKRNLEVFEIAEQVLFFARCLKKEKKRVTNVVFMGMGEPFLNYDNVLGAIHALNDKNGLNIGARNISISTCGVIEGIRKLAQENLQVNMALSLHAPNNELRAKIMPVNKKYPIRNILKAVDEYIRKTKRKVMFEYLLIKDVNDSDASARELAMLINKNPLYFLNLILYNQTEGDFKPSSFERVKKFRDILKQEGVNFSQRHRFGDDIGAACGQFATK